MKCNTLAHCMYISQLISTTSISILEPNQTNLILGEVDLLFYGYLPKYVSFGFQVITSSYFQHSQIMKKCRTIWDELVNQQTSKLIILLINKIGLTSLRSVLVSWFFPMFLHNSGFGPTSNLSMDEPLLEICDPFF